MSTGEPGLHLQKEECVYTKCYCEENVWKLCDSVREKQPSELDNCFCVFISNKNRTIPLWKQQASQDEDAVVVWDYHVIFIYKPNPLVYDLDTTLPFPCDFMTYTLNGIRPDGALQPQYHRLFRVIPAKEFLQTFASDRSHMLNDKGEYLATPPSYPCIKTQDTENNIQDFINMDPSVRYGSVMTLDELVRFFCQK